MRKYIIILLISFSSGTFADSRGEPCASPNMDTPSVSTSPVKKVWNGADSLLRKIYMRADYDTAYIERSPGKIGMKGWANLSGLNFYGRGHGVKADLKTDRKATLSFEFDYYDLALELALNPARLTGRNKDYEFNLNLYSTRFSLEASYQMAKTLSGDIHKDSKMVTMEKGWLHTKILNVAAYYTFNYRRFSYDAPFYQLYKQKRSAGSWLAGFSFQGGSLHTGEDFGVDKDTTHISDVYIGAGHLGIGGGYAYNFVAGKHWLLHASAIPSLIVWSQDKITIDHERRYVNTKFPTFMINGRVAAVYFFNQRHFMGFNIVTSNLMKRNNITGMRQKKWLARLFYGVRI